MGDNPLQAVSNRFPQVGEIEITEAPEAISDLTQGDEGMETPPPNHSLNVSLSPQVGGHLGSFRRDWQTNKCSNNLLNIIAMVTIYHLSQNTNWQSPDSLKIQGPTKDLALAACIQSLLSKNTIEMVENLKPFGFYSRLFLVPKPHQLWRPVIDLSRLNIFLLVERFKMQTPESIRASLIPGEWVSLIDLSDLSSHPHPPKLKKVPTVLLQFTGVPVHLPPRPTGLYIDCKGSEADGPYKGS